MRYAFLILLALALSACKTPLWETGPEGNLRFSLTALAAIQPETSRPEVRPDGTITLTGSQTVWLGDSALNTRIGWEEYRFLVAEVYHENPYTTVLYTDFYRQNLPDSLRGKPWMQPRVGILPFLPTQVVIPLSHLDGQEIYIDDRPRVVKAMAFGKPMSAKEILQVGLRVSPNQPPHFQPALQIRNLYLSRTEPAPLPPAETPVVDAFGQWMGREWPGKVQTAEELVSRLNQLSDSVATAAFPAEWTRYGGLKALNFGASGFFRTHYDGKRWWLVDPEGAAFLSAGMDAVRNWSPFMLEGDEDLFAQLPSNSDSLLATCYVERGNIAGRSFKMVDLARANLMRAFGKEWQQKWEQLAPGLLKTWRFNTLGNWSDGRLNTQSGLPWVLPLGSFPETKIRLFRDFPDVFAPEYAEKSESYARQLEKYRNDRNLIGYFMRNEPHWAFGNFNLALEMLASGEPSVSKDSLVNWLRGRYQQDIGALNRAWNVSFADFTDLLTMRIVREAANRQMQDDLWAFSALMVDRYVGIPAAALRRTDPVHLNLGMRYSFIENELCYQAASYFDVFSINGYHRPGPPPTAEITRRTGKPVMIGEFHFGAVDRGLPTNGIQGVLTQKQRAQAYRYYVEQGFARPELLGIHYFLFLDQPINGRWDGENHNIGFVDVTFTPYLELTQTAALAHSRMYQIALGQLPPSDQAPPDIAKNSE